MRHLVLSSLLLLGACGSDDGQVPPLDPAPGGDAERPAGDEPDAGDTPDAGQAPDADGPGDPAAPRTLAALVEDGASELHSRPRADFGVLAIHALPGGETAQLEVRRDEAYGHRRRVVVSGSAGFVRDEAEGEVFHDVVAHPSGALSIALEDTRLARDGFFVLRLSPAGAEQQRLPLQVTLPESDRDPLLAEQSFLMRARPLGALSRGWLRLVAQGEGLVAALQSRVQLGSSQQLGSDLASAVLWLDAAAGGELALRRARLVDGQFKAEPPIWNYDELGWIDVLMRPLLAVDELGNVFVGRAYNQSRCYAAQRVFGEGTRPGCFERAASNTESRTLPFFFTMFDPDGARLASHVFTPAHGFYYGVFDMAARGGAVALVGTTSDEDAQGHVRFYAPSPGAPANMVPFDGFVAVLDGRSGALRFDVRTDNGRADLWSAVRWLDEGLLVAGATGWDRWDGGMSISRGASPWLGFVSDDGTLVQRVFPGASTQRHDHLWAVERLPGAIVAGGVSDAPMTHSGDGGQLAAMSFGALQLRLR